MHGGTCSSADLHQDLSPERITWAEIDFRHYSTWYTAWDATNPHWDNCHLQANKDLTPYTCGKTHEFGGSAAGHELGHVLGLTHPQDVDSKFHGTTSGSAVLQANCTLNARATMCVNPNPSYFPNKRTLEAWDRDSIARTWQLFYN